MLNEDNKTGLCSAKDSAFLIVDIQKNLCDVMPTKVISRLIRHSKSLLTASDMLDVPVLVTEQYPKGLGKTHEDIELSLPEDAARFSKTSFSCCAAEGFLNHLNGLQKKQVILVGMESHICILQTALELKNMGLEIFVVADAVCSRARDSYEFSLSRLQQAGVIVTNAESVLFEWMKDSDNPNFSVLSKLV